MKGSRAGGGAALSGQNCENDVQEIKINQIIKTRGR
jgi:hypothetical protein